MEQSKVNNQEQPDIKISDKSLDSAGNAMSELLQASVDLSLELLKMPHTELTVVEKKFVDAVAGVSLNMMLLHMEDLENHRGDK